MRDCVYNGEIDLKYIFRGALKSSDVLVVSFPGAAGNLHIADQIGYNYMLTIGSLNVNALYIQTNRDTYTKSRMTCINREFLIERSIRALINKIADETQSKRIIVIGSSMGGWCALYYGLKYDYDIIAAAPRYTFKSDDEVLYTAGGNSEEDYAWCDALLPNIIKEAGVRGYNKRIFILWGNGEPNWRNPKEGPSLIADIEKAGIVCKYSLYNYSTHGSVARLFPNILKRRLNLLLENALESETENIADSDAEELLSPETKTMRNVTNLMRGFLPYNDLLINTEKNLNIQSRFQYGDNNPTNQLKIFVYAVQGYHWFSKLKEAFYCGGIESFWGSVPLKNGNYALSFSYQQTVLNYFKETANHLAYIHISENIRQYLYQVDSIVIFARKAYSSWSNALQRTHFFLNYLCESKESDLCISRAETEKIHAQILMGMTLILKTELLPSESTAQWQRILGLLHIIQYLRKNIEFFEFAYKSILNIIAELISYYFDDNGVCISHQVYIQHALCSWIERIIDFISANEFPESPLLKRLTARVSKIQDVAALLIRPDGVLPALGHSSSISATRERKSGSFLQLSSNLAVLSDELSYITINSGTNIHAALKHCDLLSFTFWYDGVQLVYDSEGGNKGLSDFARSAVAHSALLCDDSNYITPTYFDWTTMTHAVERETHALIGMSHMLVDGVTLKRTLLWVKPNVLIIVDNAESADEHLYTQNFILPKAGIDTSNKHCVILEIEKSYTLTIMQEDAAFELRQYTGTTNIDAPEAELRGSRCVNFTKLIPMLNLAYNKRGQMANFLTVLEAHSGKDTEVSVKTLSVEGGVLKATLEDKNGNLLTIEERVDVEIIE